MLRHRTLEREVAPEVVPLAVARSPRSSCRTPCRRDATERFAGSPSADAGPVRATEPELFEFEVLQPEHGQGPATVHGEVRITLKPPGGRGT